MCPAVKFRHRRALLADAHSLFELRARSIRGLAPVGMSAAQAEQWAADHTLAGMERKLRDFEIWIAEIDGTVVGWGAICGCRLEALYVDPGSARQGVGTALLAHLEAEMRKAGVDVVHAESSSNAEAFYARRGYSPAGARTVSGAQPITKALGTPA